MLSKLALAGLLCSASASAFAARVPVLMCQLSTPQALPGVTSERVTHIKIYPDGAAAVVKAIVPGRLAFNVSYDVSYIPSTIRDSQRISGSHRRQDQNGFSFSVTKDPGVGFYLGHFSMDGKTPREIVCVPTSE